MWVSGIAGFAPRDHLCSQPNLHLELKALLSTSAAHAPLTPLHLFPSLFYKFSPLGRQEAALRAPVTSSEQEIKDPGLCPACRKEQRQLSCGEFLSKAQSLCFNNHRKEADGILVQHGERRFPVASWSCLIQKEKEAEQVSALGGMADRRGTGGGTAEKCS